MSKKLGRPTTDAPLVRVHFIPELAEARAMNQSDLASAVSVNPSTVSGWFQGAIPTPALQHRLAELFQVDIQSLFRHPADDALIHSVSNMSSEEKLALAEALEACKDGPSNAVIRVLRGYIAAAS